MIKIINKFCSMRISNKEIPAGTIAEVNASEYQELSIMYRDVARIIEEKDIVKVEPKEEILVKAEAFKIEKKKKKNK